MTQYLTVFACAAFVAALLWAEYRQNRPLKWLAKPAASLAFVLLAISVGGLETAYGGFIVTGLVLCLTGDVLLMGRGDKWFFSGMIAFAGGHSAYIAAFLVIFCGFSVLSLLAFGLLAAGIGAVLKWLWPHLGTFRAPVAAYCVIIGAMTLLSFTTNAGHGTPYWPAVIGAAGFAISDIAVARDQFVRPNFFNKLWGLPLYYGAQLLLASSASL